MKGKKISVSELQDIEILYKGDIYELACLILKLYDARCGHQCPVTAHAVWPGKRVRHAIALEL
jgi:hypothetical protein